MNRSYLLLISLLILIAVGVGSFAFYKTGLKKETTTIVQPSPPPQEPAASKTMPPNPPENIDTSKNSLPLVITSPKTNSTVSSPTITVSGTTAPNADVAVNDKDLTANSRGEFSTTLTLDEGQNDILITVSNESGSSLWEGLVTYTPAQ